jgi:pimeloyl-ACP methyl ester carboxylesterase
MDCASGATKDRMARIAREAKDCLLGNAMNTPFPEVGEAWGRPDLGDGFRGPIHTDVRTLFVSGTLDSNTLPVQADEVRATFTRNTHLVVANAGHEDMLVHPQVQATLVDFYRGKEVSKVRIALPPPKFLPIPAPKTRD